MKRPYFHNFSGVQSETFFLNGSLDRAGSAIAMARKQSTGR